ncbi:DUF4124 domain-containing protein [Luteimonas sp. SX5]|uniref:DUF4124 domain-containing protein n=1 Tax=Luteimonas galliterrae TaxID=2940486 RepID=A0ABT0MJB4_9GAMM|nr:DUF4124 domain-containing protein [Luteimonas galliterrae]MCL1634961.1 DUF4124 domain-containing protein [Luteimonas galliterrae]
MRSGSLIAIAGTLLLPLAVQAAEITLYRCVDAKGKVTLRDSPCAKGETQETRTFQRPVDPPPRPAAQAPAPSAPAKPPEVRYVTVNTPRPLYECVTPDGERYTSDTDAGNPRWVPLWTLGYPMWPQRTFRSEGLTVSTPAPRPPDVRPPGRPHPVHPAFFASSTYIADECHALPQEEVCSRLNDRRYEIKRRYFNAMPSERAVLDNEERAVVARMNSDCGAY